MQHLKLLDSVPIHNIEHFGRPLTEHLVGTYDLLARWGNPTDVCLAGLFHSIYGTKTFHTVALTAESREQLRTLIGEYAEYLVFIFGMSDRRHLLLENLLAPYCWINYRTGVIAEISSNTFSHLIEIEVANFIEQIPFLKGNSDLVIKGMRNRFKSNTSHMSAGAKKAFRCAFGGKKDESIYSEGQPFVQLP